MQPTSHEQVGRILALRPDVTLENIREYDRLLANRANINPNIALDNEGQAELAAMNERIGRLHELLFK